MAVTQKDLNRVVLAKGKQQAEDMRDTTVVIQAGEIIQKDGKPTTKKPNKPFRNAYSAKNDFVAGALRMIMKDYFSSKQTAFEYKGSLIVRKSENDFAIKVSKLKYNVEAKPQASTNPTTAQVIALVNSLDGVYVVGNSNNEVVVSTSNFQQYVIRITKKKERVVVE